MELNKSWSLHIPSSIQKQDPPFLPVLQAQLVRKPYLNGNESLALPQMTA